MRESLSSNHYGHDQQLADVVSYLEHNDPTQYAAFLAQYPEWPKLGFVGTSSQLVWVSNPAIGTKVVSQGARPQEGVVVNYQHDWPEVKWGDGQQCPEMLADISPPFDLSNWMVDWIETNTDVYWEDGEPWISRTATYRVTKSILVDADDADDAEDRANSDAFGWSLKVEEVE